MENHEVLNDNYELCEKRLLNLYKKVKQDPELMKRYDEIVREKRHQEPLKKLRNLEHLENTITYYITQLFETTTQQLSLG